MFSLQHLHCPALFVPTPYRDMVDSSCCLTSPLQLDTLLLLFSQTVFRGHQKSLGRTLVCVVMGLIHVFLCSIFHHRHLLPRFSPLPPLSSLNDNTFSYFSSPSCCIFFVLFKGLFLAFLPLFYSIVSFTPGDGSLVISEDLSLSSPAVSRAPG